jgi:prepilin-type N-terminal cleavage/methylation domain-containing protein
MNRPLTSDNGFTLTEVLVAFSLVASATILGLQAFATGMAQINRIKAEVTESEIQRAKLEAVLTGSLDNDASIARLALGNEVVDWTPLRVILLKAGPANDEQLETIIISASP